MAKKDRARKPRGKKRGPLPALALCLGAAVLCWAGLSAADRRIRAATIYQSPPLWQLEEELDPEGEGVWRLTILGREAALDLSPLQDAARELSLILRTPPAPVRLILQIGGEGRVKRE